MKRVFTITIISILSICFILAGVFISRAYVLPTKTVMSSMMIAGMSKNELIYKADLIIKGKVGNIISCEWSNPDNVLGTEINNDIKTYVSVEILEVYKGTPYNVNSVVVAIEGGQIGRTLYKNTSAPKLDVGDDVILFLDDKNKYPNLDYYPVKNSYSILGFRQGKYLLGDDNKYTAMVAGDDKTIDLSTFEDEISYALNEYALTRIPDLTKEEIAAINNQSMGE